MTFMNIPLPSDNNLPVEYLAGIFSNTTNSYKFYWFLAILDHITKNHTPIIPIDELLTNMVIHAWYPANYCRLWFGKQDQLCNIARLVQADITAKRDKLRDTILTNLKQNVETIKQTKNLGRYVPYHFLTPFLTKIQGSDVDKIPKKQLVEIVNEQFNQLSKPSLYRLANNTIEIHPNWFSYLQQHHYILHGFCLWHLTKYIQKYNPNVPNIVAKLFPPENRDLTQAKEFWDFVFKSWGTVNCIYSDQSMRQNYSLDHFLPWRFVIHDYIWNIIPTPQPVNSSKSDRIPNMDKYFDKFVQLQYDAFRIVANSTKKTLVEDYTILFKEGDVEKLKQMPFEDFQKNLQNVIMPQVQVARNMGFKDWEITTT